LTDQFINEIQELERYDEAYAISWYRAINLTGQIKERTIEFGSLAGHS
jgi:hypothetical protein